MKKILAILFTLTISTNFNTINATKSKISKPEHEKPFYISTDCVYPGQIRYSEYIVKRKMNEHIQNGKVNWDKESQNWKLQYFDNTCLFPLSKSLPVAKSPYGYVLVDGHHHYLANLRFNATNIPIKVVADFSKVSLKDFFDLAEEKGLIHPYDVYGRRRNLLKSFLKLENDSNRLFASLCKRRFTGSSKANNSKGNKYPIWIKIGGDIPFIEMRISEELWKSGNVYDEKQGFEPDVEFYEKARKVISSAKIEGLRVIPTRTHYKDIDLSLIRNK